MSTFSPSRSRHSTSSSTPVHGGTADELTRNHIFEGQLFKFTNVVRGWQYRWFVLNPESGHLDYFLIEENSVGHPVIGKQRASKPLAGTIVIPSEEDSQTFSIVFVCGETYKLKASNSKERQVWVDRIRHVGQLFDAALALNHCNPLTFSKPGTPPQGARSHLSYNGEPSEALQNLSLSVLDAFGSVHDILQQTDTKHQLLALSIETLPVRSIILEEKAPSCIDQDLLLIKATSQAALQTLESSLSVLQELQDAYRQQGSAGRGKFSSPLPISPKRSLNSSFFGGTAGSNSGFGLSSIKFGGSSQSVNLNDNSKTSDTISLKSVQIPSKKAFSALTGTGFLASTPSGSSETLAKDELKKIKQKSSSSSVSSDKEKTGQGS